MAERKPTAKKKTARKTNTPKRSSRDHKGNERSLLGKCLRLLCICFLIALIALSAVYYFSSFETRNQLHAAAINMINPMRHANWMPKPVAALFNTLYDHIPSSDGLIVDGGELGRGDNPILAGIPQTRKSVRILQNTSYVNLFDEKERQSLCIIYRIGQPTESANNTRSDQALKDPRVHNLNASDMHSNEWLPQPIALPSALSEAFGSKGHNEAMLLSNCAPLTQDFVGRVWQPLNHMVAINYPQRFGEIWIYSGPVYDTNRSKLASGLQIPNALYLIAFDITDSGGLRAIAFLVPTQGYDGRPLSDYLTSIKKIEQVTGLRFLPEIGYDAKDVLESWVSPTLW